MIRRTVDNLRSGMILARGIMNPGRPQDDLLTEGYELSDRSISALRRFHVGGVWIEDDELGSIDELIPLGVEKARRDAIAQSKASFEALERHPRRKLDPRPFERVVNGLIDAAAADRPSFACVENFASYENFLFVHSANVCLLSIVLARSQRKYLLIQRDRPQANFGPELRELALGAILHDIGNIRLNPEIRYRPDSLSDDEMEEVRQHTRHGYDLIRHEVSPLAAQVALNHHQRWNGEGYPVRRDYKTHERRPPLAGESIPVFCRFVALADVYDTAVGEQFFSESKSPAQVLQEMLYSINDGWFDPALAESFSRVVPAFPPGTTVRLSTGAEAAVMDFPADNPGRPRVMLLTDTEGNELAPGDREEIDLAAGGGVTITHWQGVRVSGHID